MQTESTIPETIAADAVSRGRPDLTQSFRLHRPRGAFCHADWCQQCLIAHPDGRRRLACQTPSSGGPTPPEPDFRTLFGRIAELLPPWFHERRLLRPAFLRQFYLRALRRLSGARRLPAAQTIPGGRWQRRDCDALVVGGGMSGLAAAAELSGAGQRVILVDAEDLGGRSRFRSERAEELAAAVAVLGATAAVALPHTTCLGLYGDKREALCSGPDGPVLIGFRRLTVATGAYDRLLPFAGNDLPGIVGLRAFERLCARRSVAAGAKVGVCGDRRAVETARAAAGAAGLGHAVDDFGGAAVTEAHGRRRIESVTTGDGRRARCDLLVLGFEQPTYELQIQAGMTATLAGVPPVVVPAGEAAIPLEVVGTAAAPPREAFAIPPMAPEAFVCPCEDVRVRDVRQAIAGGFADIELVKRRTGAGTGPCQGKLCHANLLWCAREMGVAVTLPTVRPLLRPTALGALAGTADAGAADAGAADG